MLDALRKIVQEVNAAKDLKTALGIIVLRVKEMMSVQVCSVYLLDEATDQYVLMATEGLNKRAIGKVHLESDEGLVGLVGTRQEPLNLPNASDHPQYRYFAETGEERYSSFLGTPIIHNGQVLGVLVVQQRERREFSEEEVSFIVTMGTQLAGVIAHAEASGSVSTSKRSPQEARFVGVVGASGAVVGQAMVVLPPADLEAVPDRKTKEIQVELDLFESAIEAVRKNIQKTSAKLAKQLRPDDLALFDAYLLMLEDHALIGDIEKTIRDGQWAQGAIRDVVLQYVQRFEAMNDPYLKERAIDIKDLGRRLLEQLQKRDQANMEFPDDTILVSEEISPSMLSEVPEGKLIGIVSVLGSSNSHVAILARAMGIPAVMGVAELPYRKMDGLKIIVNGFFGEVITNPSDELCQYYLSMAEEEKQLLASLNILRDLPCVTLDGHRISLWVNTGLQADVDKAQQRGAEGVGLYRTEVPFMINSSFPSEKEQMAIYREQLQAFHPLPVTMRTLDIGGDKSLPYFPIEEENPFLGWRGIRITLDHPEIFILQIRAMLKASEGLGNLKILLPMISSMHEVEHALRMINRAWYEVREEGIDVEMPPIGVMIEVPSAVFLTRMLAKEVDFVSVGSNDLTQYLLAVDRNNARVADLYNYYHPAVLHSLYKTVKDCHAEGKTASICGEMAGDPAAAILLLAMGFDSLSMNATNLPKVKWVLRQLTMVKAKEILDDVLKQDDPQVVKSIINLELSRLGLKRIVAPSKKIN